MDPSIDAAAPSILQFLRLEGFPGDASELEAVSSWLGRLEVCVPCDFKGLGCVRALPGAPSLTATTLRFMQRLVSVHFHYAFAWPPLCPLWASVPRSGRMPTDGSLCRASSWLMTLRPLQRSHV